MKTKFFSILLAMAAIASAYGANSIILSGYPPADRKYETTSTSYYSIEVRKPASVIYTMVTLDARDLSSTESPPSSFSSFPAGLFIIFR